MFHFLSSQRLHSFSYISQSITSVYEKRQVHDLSVKVDAKISESSEALKFLSSYGPGMCVCGGLEVKLIWIRWVAGGSQIIKDAISKPGDPQIQEGAWEKMLPLIKNLLELKQSYAALNQVRSEK